LTKPEPQYEVQLAAPNAAQASLMRVWRNLEVKGDLKDKFHWTYEQAPYLPDTAFLLKVHDEVVGSAGYGIRAFRVFGSDKRVAVMADLAVDAAHRSLAPALSLVRASREFVQKQFDFAYGWPNNKAEGVFARARYKSLGRLYRYVRVLRYEAYMDRVGQYTERLARLTHLPPSFVSVLTKPPVASVGTRALSYGSRLRHQTSTVRIKRTYALQWTTAGDARIDSIWHAARDQYGIISERTSQFLRWRFANDNVRVALLLNKANNSACAYAVIRVEDGDAQVVDIFGVPDALSPLLNLLIAALGQEGTVHAISCVYLGQSRFLRVLQDCGFEKRDEKGRAVYLCAGQVPDGLSPQLEQAEHWHLTAFDEDV
jgi:hypothetical protein